MFPLPGGGESSHGISHLFPESLAGSSEQEVNCRRAKLGERNPLRLGLCGGDGNVFLSPKHSYNDLKIVKCADCRVINCGAVSAERQRGCAVTG